VTVYVAMLRGINVSGRNKLPMEDLRGIVTSAGGRDVETYIQSGNAIFSSGSSVSAITKALEGGLENVLGTRVPVIVRTGKDLDAVVHGNPYVAAGQDLKALHVTFMAARPDPRAVESATPKRADGDEFQVVGREIYLLCPNGYGNTKLTNTFFERKLGAQATTRNWKTVATLAELASR
jgi:uncharacterized protein (DUF1697 family)